MVLDVQIAKKARGKVYFKEILNLDQNILAERRVKLQSCLSDGWFEIEEDFLVIFSKNIIVTTQACDVCNKEFEMTHEFEVNEKLNINHNEDNAFPIISGKVNYDNIVLSEFLLLFPSKMLCNENCSFED